MRKTVEEDTVVTIDEAREIRTAVESKLGESEDLFTRLSHRVDIMIYQIEPIVELISYAGFNENLCGTGIVKNWIHLNDRV